MASSDDQQEIQRNLNRIDSSTDSSGQPQYCQQQHHFHHNALVDVANNTKISQICELDKNVSASQTVELHRNIDRYFRKSVSDSSISDDGGSGGMRKDLVTIVTISGCTETESSTGEMDILAHL